MTPIEPDLQAAIRLHRAGEVAQARTVYERYVKKHPNDADALNLLGLALRQLEEFEPAARVLRRAIMLDGSQAAFHANLGEVLQSLGQVEGAIECYQRAAEIEPNQIVVQLNLGSLLSKAGKLDEALLRFRRAVELAPDHQEANFLLAEALERSGDPDAARVHFKRVVQGPDKSDQLHVYFGMFLLRQKQSADAEQQFKLALDLRESAEALVGLGVAVQEQDRRDEAKRHYQRALHLKPGDLAASFNLGAVLHDEEDYAAAAAFYAVAEASDEFRVRAIFGSGAMALAEADWTKAKAQLRRVLMIEPEHVDANYFLGTTLLAEGSWQEGWPLCEYRLKRDDAPRLDATKPIWKGEALDRGVLLVCGEQGLGDTLQFLRFVSMAQQRAGNAKVMIEAAPGLLPLLRQSGFPNIIPNKTVVDDVVAQLPIMSLAKVLWITPDSLPGKPYLSVDQEHVEQWRQHLKNVDGFRVGIHWQGRKSYKGDNHRSFPLQQFEPLARIDNVRLVSLQKGEDEQIARVADRFQVTQLPGLDEQGGAFVDTAAVIKNLDLVITSDSAVAHVAGALGAPTWLVLSKRSDWRWMRDREDSPWYPSMRLWRQKTLDDWPELFGRIAGALAEHIRQAPS